MTVPNEPMVVPASMNAVTIREPGGPEMLQIARIPIPQPGPGEVLIKVAAAGVNRPDCLQRAGHYAPPPGASPHPGLEAAGTVVAVGPRQSESGDTDADDVAANSDPALARIGARVCALVPGGGYGQYCLTQATHCLPIPAPLDMLQAAALPETFFTVWYNLFMRGRLKQGEWLLVHGGSSGIGTTAIQLATQCGARVITTAGSPEKCTACRELGAELAINYRRGDWPEAVRDATGEHGLDVILDMVGGDYIQPGLDLLARDGRYLFIAFLGGARARVDFSTLLHKRISMSGSTLRPRTVAEKAAIAQGLRERVWPLLESAAVAPVIHRVFPLEQAAEAHALMESSRHIGKIMLRVD